MPRSSTKPPKELRTKVMEAGVSPPSLVDDSVVIEEAFRAKMFA